MDQPQHSKSLRLLRAAHWLRRVGCAQDPNWRSLLQHCAAHGAFRGAGAELVAGLQLPRGDAEGAASCSRQ